MCDYKRFSIFSIIWLILVVALALKACAQTSLKAIDNPQGGKIIYGLVNGATTPASAMAQILHIVQNNCGDKPQVGKVFRVRGSDSDAVFFTVTNHPQGNVPVAGMLIAAPTGPKTVEAALVSDSAARFGQTVNPMLNQLFGEWHPGGGQPSGSMTGGGLAPAQPLHRVVAQDNSASVAIPDGWTFKANGGTAMVAAPNYNVLIDINLVRGATTPNYYQRYGAGAGMAAKIVYPSNVDPARAFPGLIKEFYRVNNQRIDYRIAHVEQMAAPSGERCAHAIGHGLLSSLNAPPPNIAEKDMPEIEALLCTTTPGPMGNYMVSLSLSEIMAGLGDRERATVGAILSSYQVNQAVVAQQANAMAAPAIAAIHQIGASATARYNATQAANDQQHADYWARQDANARTNQGFHNYLLDQTVVQDNNMYGNGTIGHATMWNSTADALVKSDPNRYEYVDDPNYWRGTDYRP